MKTLKFKKSFVSEPLAVDIDTIKKFGESFNTKILINGIVTHIVKTCTCGITENSKIKSVIYHIIDEITDTPLRVYNMAVDGTYIVSAEFDKKTKSYVFVLVKENPIYEENTAIATKDLETFNETDE